MNFKFDLNQIEKIFTKNYETSFLIKLCWRSHFLKLLAWDRTKLI
ncbi:hypothetical protein [Hyella patelloides]|nr:hypothetical protein [Hyella patelloides]